MPVEADNSEPLTEGLRGFFIEDPFTGNLDGWLLDGATWTFKSIFIPGSEFNPVVAPDLSTYNSNEEWVCEYERVVFDDVHCSRPIFDKERKADSN